MYIYPSRHDIKDSMYNTAESDYITPEDIPLSYIDTKNIKRIINKNSFLQNRRVEELDPYEEFPSKDQSLFDSIIRVNDISISTGGRIEYWKVALDLIERRPFIGFGLGSFASAYYLEYNMNAWFSRFAHNHYLQLLSEIGIIGFILFVLFLIFSFVKPMFQSLILKEIDNKRIYLTASFAFLLHIFVDFSWNFPAVSAFFFLLLGYSYEKIKSKYNIRKFVLVISCISLLFSVWIITSDKIISKSISSYTSDNDEGILIIERYNKFNLVNPYPLFLHSSWMINKYIETDDNEYLEKAFHSASKGLKKSPYELKYLVSMAKIYEHKNDLISAEKFYNDAIDVAAYNSNIYLALGDFYKNNNETIKAIETYESFMPLKTFAINAANAINDQQTIVDIVLIHAHLANLYEEIGDTKKSDENLNEVADMINKHEFLKKYFKFQ